MKVPLIRLDVDRTYGEIAGTNVENRGDLNGQPVLDARQAIRFVLDETGAKLESSAHFTTEEAKDTVRIRHFIFNKPFLVLLARNSGTDEQIGEPYFAMWIETPELLQTK